MVALLPFVETAHLNFTLMEKVILKTCFKR